MNVVPGELFLACNRPRYDRKVVPQSEENPFPFRVVLFIGFWFQLAKFLGCRVVVAGPEELSLFWSLAVEVFCAQKLLTLRIAHCILQWKQKTNKQKKEDPKIEV